VNKFGFLEQQLRLDSSLFTKESQLRHFHAFVRHDITLGCFATAAARPRVVTVVRHHQSMDQFAFFQHVGSVNPSLCTQVTEFRDAMTFVLSTVGFRRHFLDYGMFDAVEGSLEVVYREDSCIRIILYYYNDHVHRKKNRMKEQHKRMCYCTNVQYSATAHTLYSTVREVQASVKRRRCAAVRTAARQHRCNVSNIFIYFITKSYSECEVLRSIFLFTTCLKLVFHCYYYLFSGEHH
jgi:hypothetical protein